MVERLKTAVAKARAERNKLLRESVVDTGGVPVDMRAAEMAGQTVPAAPRSAPQAQSTPVAGSPVDQAWSALEETHLDTKHLERNRIITHDRANPAYVAFDMLRTQILRAFTKHGWSRMGITSPTKGCGKTFTAANLTLSLARQKDCRTVLMDLDLRAPALAKTLGVGQLDPISWFLNGDVPTHEILRRVNGNLALGLNDERVPNAAETLLAPNAQKTLNNIQASLEPDVIVYDLPPMLSCDDVLGFLPQLDCILLVVCGGMTRPDEIAECERLLADQTHLLGVLLNKGEEAKSTRYGYEG